MISKRHPCLTRKVRTCCERSGPRTTWSRATFNTASRACASRRRIFVLLLFTHYKILLFIHDTLFLLVRFLLMASKISRHKNAFSGYLDGLSFRGKPGAGQQIQSGKICDILCAEAGTMWERSVNGSKKQEVRTPHLIVILSNGHT